MDNNGRFKGRLYVDIQTIWNIWTIIFLYYINTKKVKK